MTTCYKSLALCIDKLYIVLFAYNHCTADRHGMQSAGHCHQVCGSGTAGEGKGWWGRWEVWCRRCLYAIKA